MKDNKLKINKKVLIFVIICSILFCLTNVLQIIMAFIKPLGNIYWLKVRNPIAGFFFKVFEVFPVLGVNIRTFLIIGLFLTILLLIIACIFKKLKKRNLIFNLTLTLLSIFVLSFVLISNVYNTSIYSYLIDHFQMKDKVNKEYGEEDILVLYDSLLNKVIEQSLEFDRDSNGEIIYTKSLEERAVNDLLNISNDYEFLKGLYPMNYKRINHGDNDYDGFAVGYTTGFGLAIDYNNSKPIILNTITHELCHTKGIMRENEAVYCSFLAGVNSPDEFSQYAAYLEAFARIDGALYDIDPETELMRVEPLLRLCLDEGFQEICQLYPKMIDSYLKHGKELEFVSYPLIDYKNHLGEIVGLLSSFQEDGGQIYIDGSLADMDYVLALIQNDSYKIFRVKFKNNRALFDKLAPVMKEQSNLFIAIQQYDPASLPQSRTREEYLDYYLKGFNNDNPLYDFMATIFEDEYDYSRVVRLLLEYYDGQEILPYEL